MLTSQWKAILRAPRTPKVILVTIVFDPDAIEAEPHPAVVPRAIRASTHGAVVQTKSGVTFPFFPTITEWPTIKRVFSPQERRAPVANTQVALTGDAKFPHDAVGPGTPPAVWARLDLWSPGIALDDVMPLVAGPVTAASYTYRHGGVVLTVEDGDTQRSVDFPAGQETITVADFPDAPDFVLGRSRRQHIFGPFPDGIPAIPISRDGRRWYLCEPACEVPPTQFQIGGAEVSSRDRPLVSVGRFGTDPSRTFTELVFPTTVANIGLYGSVSASRGVGLAVDSAPLTLLRDIGKYRLSERAERDLLSAARRFNFSVFLNKSGSVLDIVRDRILPQTDLVLTFRLNRIDTIRLRGQASEGRLALGQGLWAYVPQQRTPSTSDTVFNVIEVRFRRNTFALTASGTLSRDSYVVDSSYGGPIGALLATSEKRYGRRPLEIEAADLVDEGTGGAPAGVVELGELTAILNARPPRPCTYDALYDVGMAIDLNDTRRITDPNEDLDDALMRLVGWELLHSGPRLTFIEEVEL